MVMTPAPISVDGAPAKVHRYDPRITPNPKTGRVDYDGMAAFPNGKWVLHSDYAALLQQLAERGAEVGRLRREFVRLTGEKLSLNQAILDIQRDNRAAERAREEFAHVAPLLLDLATSHECDTLSHDEVSDLRKLAAASGGKADA